MIKGLHQYRTTQSVGNRRDCSSRGASRIPAARLMLLPSMHPGSLDGVVQHSGNCHGPDPSRHRRHSRCHLADFLECHISHNPLLLMLAVTCGTIGQGG